MNKITFLLPITILFTALVSGQQLRRSFFINIAGGLSVPVGKFADKDPFTPHGGGAKPGPAVQLSARYMFSKHWGAAFLAGGSINKRDERAIEEAIRRSNTGADIRTSIDRNSWKPGRLMLGGVYETAISSSPVFSFRSGVFAGFCKTTIPASEVSYAVMNNGAPASVSSAEVSKVKLPWIFCYQFQTGLKYQFNKTLGLAVDISYFAASRKFNYWSGSGVPVSFYGSSPYVPSTTTRFEERLRLNAVNAMVSLEIGL